MSCKCYHIIIIHFVSFNSCLCIVIHEFCLWLKNCLWHLKFHLYAWMVYFNFHCFYFISFSSDVVCLFVFSRFIFFLSARLWSRFNSCCPPTWKSIFVTLCLYYSPYNKNDAGYIFLLLRGLLLLCRQVIHFNKIPENNYRFMYVVYVNIV